MKSIKRYDNRKMYDVSESQYVSTKDVIAWIQAGVQVQAFKHDTKEDITREVILSSINEQGRVLNNQDLINLLQKAAEQFNGGQNV